MKSVSSLKIRLNSSNFFCSPQGKHISVTDTAKWFWSLKINYHLSKWFWSFAINYHLSCGRTDTFQTSSTATKSHGGWEKVGAHWREVSSRNEKWLMVRSAQRWSHAVITKLRGFLTWSFFNSPVPKERLVITGSQISSWAGERSSIWQSESE